MVHCITMNEREANVVEAHGYGFRSTVVSVSIQ